MDNKEIKDGLENVSGGENNDNKNDTTDKKPSWIKKKISSVKDILNVPTIICKYGGPDILSPKPKPEDLVKILNPKKPEDSQKPE